MVVGRRDISLLTTPRLVFGTQRLFTKCAAKLPMELLLELNESHRPLRLAVDGNGAFKTIEDELKKCKKEISLSVCSSDDSPLPAKFTSSKNGRIDGPVLLTLLPKKTLRMVTVSQLYRSEVQVKSRSLEPRHQPFAVVRKSPTRQMLEFLAAYLRRPPVLRGRGQIALILLKSVLQRRNKRRRRELLDSSPAKLQCC